MIKELPVSYPPITNYLSTACYLSALLSNRSLKSWFYSNFIDLYFVISTDHKFKIDFYTGKYGKYITNLEFIDFIKLQTNEIPKADDSILELIKRKICNNYYVIPVVNEYYLPNKWAYLKQNFYHNILLYGFDDEKGVVYAGTWGKHNKFTLNCEIGFEYITRALESFADNKEIALKHNQMVVFKSNYLSEHYEFNIDYIKNSFTAYMLSKNLSYKYGLYASPYTESYKGFGIDVYKYLKLYIDICVEAEDNIEVIPFYSIYCHKKCMVDRIIYMIDNNYIIKNKSLILEGYKIICEKTRTCYLNIFKTGYSTKVNRRSFYFIIKKLIDEIYVMEKEILAMLIDNI